LTDQEVQQAIFTRDFNMTHRERVVNTYNHKEPDRVPVCVGGTAQKYSRYAYYNLKKKLKIESETENEKVLDELGNVIYYHPDVMEYVGSDFRHIHIRRSPPKKTFDDGSWEHELGFKLKVSAGGEIVNIITHPLEDASSGDIAEYPWPDPGDKSRFQGLREEAKNLYENTDYAIAAYKATLLGIFDLSCIMRRMDKLLMDFILDEKFADTLLEKALEFNFIAFESFLQEVGDYVDVVEFNDDLGTQDNLLLSPDLYRKFIKPRHKKLVEMFKKNTKRAKVLYHCCGSVYDIIQDFIEIGIDILNPVQPLASRMDTYTLKKEFGKDICFQGGIDLQEAMRGSLDDVEKEVIERIKSMAPGGGYVLSSANNIASDIPVENILKMYESARKYGKYPLNL
jgi:uroporphyrinogen decarboxylase